MIGPPPKPLKICHLWIVLIKHAGVEGFVVNIARFLFFLLPLLLIIFGDFLTVINYGFIVVDVISLHIYILRPGNTAEEKFLRKD